MHAPKYPEDTKAPLAMLMNVAIVDRMMDDDFDSTDVNEDIGAEGGDNLSSTPSKLPAPDPPPPPRSVVNVMSPVPMI